MLLLFFASNSFGQSLSDSVMVKRTDSILVSGHFINNTGSNELIYYTINHNLINNTVNIQITSLDSIHFTFDIMDTTFRYVSTSGAVNYNRYTATVDISTLNMRPYLLFRFNTDIIGPTAMFYTTFK